MLGRFAKFFKPKDESLEGSLREVYDNCLNGVVFSTNQNECAALIEDVLNDRKGARSLLHPGDRAWLTQAIRVNSEKGLESVKFDEAGRKELMKRRNDVKEEMYKEVVGEDHPRAFRRN